MKSRRAYGGQAHLVGERDVHERRRAVAAGHGHLADPRLERAASLLDHLARELLETVEALVEDDPLDGLADEVAAGEPRLLVEQVVHRRARRLADALQMPGGELVVLADLHARQVQAVLEARHRAHRDAAGRRGADVQDVGDAARPGDQLAAAAGIEDRDERLHVGVVHVADPRVVVGEDVARPDLRVGLVVVADHPLDRVRHRVDVDDDPGRERDRVALRGVEREAQLAELAHDRRGRDVHRRLARGDEPAAEPAEQLLVADRVGLHELQALEALVATGLAEAPLGRLEHVAQASGRPSRSGGRVGVPGLGWPR